MIVAPTYETTCQKCGKVHKPGEPRIYRERDAGHAKSREYWCLECYEGEVEP